MRIALFLFFSFIASFLVFAQNDSIKPLKPVEVKVSGFVMNNLFYDTRKNAEAADGMILIFPLPVVKDSFENDMNQVPNISLLSFASRLRFSIAGQEAFGAKSSAFIEFDFTARSTQIATAKDNTVASSSSAAAVRFRQGWAKLNWEKGELLVGRAWHPLASTDVLPSVMSLNIGVPFQPFNRSEQITYTYMIGKLNMIASAIYQNDFINNGPTGKSYLYQNNTLLPNLHAQLKYKSDNLIAGIGADYKRLKPKTSVTNYTKKINTTDEIVECPAFLAFGQYKKGKLQISGKSILASNPSENVMTGAYGTYALDTLSGIEKYTPFKHFFIWGNIAYGEKLKVSLFAGYLKNLGTSKNLIPHSKTNPTVFGLGETIGEMVRVTPTLSYTSGKMTLALELEHNITTYGSIDHNNKGKIINTNDITGTRVLACMLYNF